MSSIKDTSVSETETQDAKCPEPPNQPSADDNTEIDAIQKHVEESLLFLDNKDLANNVSVTMDSISNPINNIVWETNEPMEKSVNITESSENKSENENISEILDSSVICSTQENNDQALTVTEQASNATDISEQIDDAKLQIAPIQPINRETTVPVENITADDQNTDKDANDNVNLQTVQISLAQDYISDSVIPIDETQDLKLLSENLVENVDNNIHSEPSSKTNTENEELISEINNSPLLEEQDIPHNIENPIQVIENEDNTLCAQNETSGLTKKSIENIENVQLQSQNTLQDIVGESSPLVETQKKTNAENINELTYENQSDTVHDSFQNSEIKKEIPISQNISDGLKLEEIEKNDCDVNLESSNMETSIDESPIKSENNKIIVDENMGKDENEDADQKSMTEIDENAISNENIVDAKPSHTIKQECVPECPIIPDSTQKATELEEMEVITIKQETVATSSSEHVEDIKMSVIKFENISNSVSSKPFEMLNNEEEMNEDTNTFNETDSNVIIEPSQTATEIQIVCEKQNEKLVFNTNNDHSGASSTINTQEYSQKETQDSVIYNKNAELVSLKVVKQDADQVTPQQTQQIHEKDCEDLKHDANSVHSESLKVEPMRDDNTDCPPAKRARVESKQSTSSENIESNAQTKQPNAPEQSYNETSTATENTLALKKSIVNMEVIKAASFDTSDTLDEAASNRSQSPCSTFIEEMEESDGEEYQTNSDIVGDVSEAEMTSFIAWCIKNEIPGDSSSLKKKLFMGKKLNKDVIRLTQLPRSYGRPDVLKFMKKYTWEVDKNIWNNISNVFIVKTLSPIYNVAYVKWKSSDKDLVIKAFQILCKEKPCIDGEPIRFSYDNRMQIDWSPSEKAIVRPIRPKILPGTQQRSQKLIEPFVNGQIDETDSELFGLSKEFLMDLNITPPLTCEIVVKNVDKLIDEYTIRKIFQRAGTIRSIILRPMERSFTNRQFISKQCVQIRIEYEHPLEAVQAISLYHCQMLYDRVLIVSMANPLNIKPKLLPPKGFTKIGPGIAPGGKIMLNVRTVIEVEQIKKKYQIEFQRIKASVKDTFNKVIEVLTRQEQLANQMKAKINNTQNSNVAQQNPQESTPQQNPENAFAALSTVINNSIQTNLLGMLGAQPNLLQGLMVQNQTPNWPALNTETHTWSQTNQTHFSPNIQPEQSLPKPGLTNIQPTNMQPAPYMQFVPNMQPTAGTIPDPNQPGYGNMVQGFIQPTLAQPFIPSTQAGLNTAQTVQPEIFPPLPNKPITADSNEKAVSRFDIPPSVVKPQNQTEPVPTPPSVQPQTDYTLEIPLPVTKPQNRKLISSNLKSGAAKAKPAGIKFNIPSFQVPTKAASSDVDMELITPPALKPQKGKEAGTSKAVNDYKARSSKAKSPENDLAWLNKQIKALRRNSKSPEKFRTYSPRHDKPKDVRRSRERDRSIDRDRSRGRDRSRERYRSIERDRSRGRDRSIERDRSRGRERDYKRPPTVFFRYLPSSVNSEDLREKMREIGKVVSAQVSSKGRAVVSFRLQQDAETCIEMYNRAKVDGETIEVKWAK